MPAPATKNNQEIRQREAGISPSLPTPLPLRHVLLSSCFLVKKREKFAPYKPLTMGNAEMVTTLQRALDLIPSDYWSDCSNDEGEQ
jgi:hypothetical protein